MIADRFEIIDDGVDLKICRGLYAYRIYHDAQHDWLECAGAIRQQARDMDQLRTDLAAAVTRAEQAEARLAAIEAASVVRALTDLVSGLEQTNWSCWQSTAYFWNALENARDALSAIQEKE